MVYIDNKFVLYTPLSLNINKTKALNECKSVLKKYGIWISSKGTKLERPNLHGLSNTEASIIERTYREEQRKQRPNDFPVKGVLLKGINGLEHSISYLITDTRHFKWTVVASECPYLIDVIKKIPFLNVGRVIIQTVEKGHSLHEHIDSVFRLDSETVQRRTEHLQQYNIKDFKINVNCYITIVLQGDGINFHYSNFKKNYYRNDDVYYFCPHIIRHSINKCNDQRIICRIEGEASTELIDMIQNNAKIFNERILTV